MTTHFEWKTPKLALSRRATKAIELALRPALQRAVPDFSVFAAVVLVFIALRPDPGSPLGFVMVSALLAALLFYVILPLRVIFAINLHLRRPSKPSLHVKLTDDRVLFTALGKVGLYKYADIQSFSIALERFEDGRTRVLELRMFDGRDSVLPLDDDVPVEDLRQFLQDRITAARHGRRQLPTRKYGAALKKHALAVMFFSALCVLAFAVVFIHTELRIAADADGTSAAAESALHARAAMSLAAAAAFGVLFLVGSILMLWGDARYLRARLARLQAYLPDSALNQRQKAGDM